MFSCTVSERKMFRSCGTQPMPAAARASGDSVAISRPPRLREPAKRRVTPTTLSISVVLPTPLRPSTASASPSPSLKPTSDSTTARP
jgi:hypothetical protein